jgi:VanZ family protein
MRWLRVWWPAIVWAACIFTFSTSAFTSENTSRIIVPVLHWLFPTWPAETLSAAHHFIRKSAHFTEYFIFSLLILRGIRHGQKGTRLGWALAAVGVVAGYAALDEFHQSFVPGRTPAFADVLLDTAGGIAAQVVAALVVLLGDIRDKRKRNLKLAGITTPDPK